MTICKEHSPALGSVNKKVLDATSQAYYVAKLLAARGFVVKGVACSTSQQPLVWLHPTGKCQSLESCMFIRGHDESGRYRIDTTVIDGCEVRWKRKGADA